MSFLVEYHMTYNLTFYNSIFLNLDHTQPISILAYQWTHMLPLRFFGPTTILIIIPFLDDNSHLNI